MPPRGPGRFLPAWHGIGASGGRGAPGRRWRVLEASSSWPGAPCRRPRWRRWCCPARVADYSPAAARRADLGRRGVWAGAGALPGGDGWVVLAPADVAPLLLPAPAEVSTTPLHAAVLEALAGGGALFFRLLSDRVGAADGAGARLTRGRRRALGPGLGRALTNDTLAPLRAAARRRPAAGAPRAPAVRAARRRDRRSGRAAAMPTRPGRPRSAGAGPCSRPRGGRSTPTRARTPSRRPLLDRHGVVTRGAVTAERVAGGFAAVYQVLRAVEEAGRAGAATSSRGWARPSSRCPGRSTGCVRWPTGAPATDGSARRPTVVLAATDPANPTARRCPGRPARRDGHGHRPGARPARWSCWSTATLVLYVERGGRTLLSWSEDPEQLQAARRGAGPGRGHDGRPRAGFTVGARRWPAGRQRFLPLAQALEAAGFRPTPRGLRLRAS